MPRDPNREEALANLGDDIVIFLCTRLPGSCSLKKASALVDEIHRLIVDAWDSEVQDAAYYENQSQLLREGSLDSGRYG